MLCRSAWLARVSHIGTRWGENIVTASVAATLLEQEGLATHFSGRAIGSPSGLRGRERKRGLIIQHQPSLTFIVRWDSAGHGGWELTLKFP